MASAAGDSAEAVFRMKPVAAIEALARVFVDSQRQLAQMRQQVDALPSDVAEDVVSEVRRSLDALAAKWSSEQAPTLAASFRLALEVLDTYGPEGITVEDPTDAAIWNNKYFVWRSEFGGVPPKNEG